MLLLLAVLVAACNSSGSKTEQKTPNGRYFHGTWSSMELNIRLESVGGIADSNRSIQADPGSWTKVLGIGPIHTTFHADNRFEAVYYDSAGQVQNQSSGYWELRGNDSLILHRLLPDPETIRHAWVRKNDSVVGFSGMVDFDRDGAQDDALFSLNTRIAR
jgi:hypothetical protein